MLNPYLYLPVEVSSVLGSAGMGEGGRGHFWVGKGGLGAGRPGRGGFGRGASAVFYPPPWKPYMGLLRFVLDK